MKEFKIGDRVIVNEHSLCVGSKGIVSRINSRELCGVILNNLRLPISFWNYELDLEETEEMKLKKEQLRLKYINIDPYGEEDWDE